MKIHWLLVILLLFGCVRVGKPKGQSHVLNNKTFEYSWIRKSLHYTNEGVELSKVLVRCKLSAKQKKVLTGLTKEEWTTLLSDSTSDWAANLVLYEISGKDAALLVMLPSELNPQEVWKACCKDEDQDFWAHYLDSHQPAKDHKRR